ncbi:MAG TPA: glycosyltransferase 87 family protein, partial [Thermoanaerobaculia bacterium]|nr:glycosyltransferase 87 family protein [Thermoanaerobaculia bacterium]
YLPFLRNMNPVYRFWDGPNYLTVARTLYDIRPDNPLLAYIYRPTYFLTHLPLYPLAIRFFSFLGYEPAMLVVSVAATAVAALLFFRLSRDVWKLPAPMFMTLVMLYLPPRWLVYRSTGATEGLYLALALASILCFERGRFGQASAWAGLATLTRITGLVFLPAYAVVLILKRQKRSLAWLALIPSGLLAYFLFCAVRFGDFFAYFRPHGEKLAVFFPFGFLPVLFQKGIYHQAEFHILLALVYAIGISRLRARPVLMWYCVFAFLLLVCVSTEDWSRYFLAMAPFAIVVGFREVLDSKPVRWILLGYIPLAVYYCWAVIPLNGCRPDIYQMLLWHLGLLKVS